MECRFNIFSVDDNVHQGTVVTSQQIDAGKHTSYDVTKEALFFAPVWCGCYAVYGGGIQCIVA